MDIINHVHVMLPARIRSAPMSRTGLKSDGFVSHSRRPAFWGASPLMGPKVPLETSMSLRFRSVA
eukprot:4302726-Pyramimonas_sp.AAC.1